MSSKLGKSSLNFFSDIEYLDKTVCFYVKKTCVSNLPLPKITLTKWEKQNTYFNTLNISVLKTIFFFESGCKQYIIINFYVFQHKNRKIGNKWHLLTLEMSKRKLYKICICLRFFILK